MKGSMLNTKKSILTINDISGSVYIECNACMSVYGDALSWCKTNSERVVSDPNDADNIIILSCQVTDLSILSDMRLLKKMHIEYPDKLIYVSGCLAQREDVSLQKFAIRLEQFRDNSATDIKVDGHVTFSKPFWVKDFEEKGNDLHDGHLFRDMYPLRIGKGCKFNCTFCTIKKTRGKYEELCPDENKIKEFIDNKDVVLICDSPSVELVKAWINVALTKRKPIAIRNIEPKVAVKCFEELSELIRRGLMTIFHCPIQHTNKVVLEDMGRSAKHAQEVVSFIEAMKAKHYFIIAATNFIIDYKDKPNPQMRDMYNIFDYISWNPYWDGVFNLTKAKERFEKYITSGYQPQ